MFTDEYLLPGFYLVKQHQRIIPHTLALLLLSAVLSVFGTLVSVVPIVAGFTFSGVSIEGLTTDQLMNLLGGNITILTGASTSLVLLLLNLFIWTSLYFGGIIQEIIDPKTQMVQAVRTAFGSIRLTLKPLMLIFFVTILLGLLGLIVGWGIWLLTQVWFLGSLLIFLGVTASIMFLFLSSLTAISSNMEKKGVIDSLNTSIALVNKDSMNYFIMLMIILLVNSLVMIIPLFGVLITLITVPVSLAAMVGYYYVNKSKLQTLPTAPAPKPAETITTAPRGVVPQVQEPTVKEEIPKAETDEERTKRILSKILRET